MRRRNPNFYWSAVWVFVVCVGTQVEAVENPPSVHLVREGQNASQVKILKHAHEQCISEKRMHLETRSTKPQLWAVMEQDMKRKRRHYDITRPAAEEPDWSKVAVQRDEEYFQGEKYARLADSSRYKVADDGSCALLAEKTKKMEIDDGENRFDLDLVKGTGTRRPSSVSLHQRLPPPRKDKTGHVTGQDTVAGERCDYLATPKTQRTKLCYWSKMHHYASVMRRPVILKSIVAVGQDANTEQAVLFEQPVRIDDNVFQPPKGIAIKDLSRR